MPSIAAPHAARYNPPTVTDPNRLDSWKEIAAYLRRDVTTVQRWERRENMPVHRHVHDKLGSVYAFRSELDVWVRQRGAIRADGTDASPGDEQSPEADGVAGEETSKPVVPVQTRAPSIRRAALWLGAAAVAAIAVGVTQFVLRDRASAEVLAEARFIPLTDFPGNEQAAALSRDGKFAAFLSDREGATDVWVTQIGTGRFYNLTRDDDKELVNASVRTLGFSPDGTLVAFWTRKFDGQRRSDINIWAAPVLGGPARPYLQGIAEFDWSRDGARLVYHTPADGDPMFVREAGQTEGKKLFSASPGQHAHFPIWSPDDRFIYFVQGSLLPDRLDIWRIPATGGTPERITTHETRVTHPVFLDERILLYLARDGEGGGPWLYAVDVERRVPHRVGFGLERYTSLQASGDGTRLVATLTTQQNALWRLPLTSAPVEPSAAERLSLSTGSGSFPRLGAGYVLYVSSKGGSDSIWRLHDDAASEVWSAADERMIGAPAISRDGRLIAFATTRNNVRSLHVAGADGTNARVLTQALELQGTPAWSPDGRSITVSAVVDGIPRLFNVPVDGGAPSMFVKEHASEPVWSPDGKFVLYSGPDVGTTFAVKAAGPDGRPYPLPPLTLTRGERHLSFLPGGRELVVLRGEIGHKNFWRIDVTSGTEQQLTNFPREFNVRDFDISPDGSQLIVEQVAEASDVVLIERPRR
jgi:Tol biopolymer transport system component